MGLLAGHVAQGLAFALVGIWWAARMCHIYHYSINNRKQFASRASFTLPILPGRLKNWPVEGCCKIAGSLAWIYAVTNGVFQGIPLDALSKQHATINVFMLVSGIIDILIYNKFAFPPDIDYISICMAFSAEFILFKFHLYDRTELDSLVHTLFVFTIGACIVATAMDMKARTSILIALSRAYFIMFQGTWLFHVGLILYPPKGSHSWCENNHQALMTATVLFAWHALLNFLLVLGIYSVTASCYPRPLEKAETVQLIKPDKRPDDNEYTALMRYVDSGDSSSGI